MCWMYRLRVLAGLALLGLWLAGCSVLSGGSELAPPPFDWELAKEVWRERIAMIRASSVVPLFDVESSFGECAPNYEKTGDWLESLRVLDRPVQRCGVAVVAYGAEHSGYPGLPTHATCPTWVLAERRLTEEFPWIMPVPRAGQLLRPDGTPWYTRDFPEILRGGYPLMGEYFFRHYPSDRQCQDPKRADMDYRIPLDGPVGDELLAFAEEHDLPVEIHLEVEPETLGWLERALERHPRAKVIWAHFGRVRYPERGKDFTPAWVESMLRRFPNLYFDTSASWVDAIYPPSKAYCSVIWDRRTRRLRPDWKAVVLAHPWHFMVALDMGSDRQLPVKLKSEVVAQRHLLSEFPKELQEILAYRAAWKLIFREELPP